MAKKPLPVKRAAGGPPPGPGGAPAKPPKSEAVGKFDRFGAFALALPTMLLGLITLVIAIGYTNREFDVGLFGFPGKSKLDWDTGGESISKTGASAQITGFETHNYIGRLSEGEVDVAVLNVGSAHNVNLGDVFTLGGSTDPSVRLEFVVFDVGDTISRAYILLGQDLSEGKERKYSLSHTKIRELCGNNTGIEVKRDWDNQIIRRYVESRSTK
jgi:hypothetical protein